MSRCTSSHGGHVGTDWMRVPHTILWILEPLGSSCFGNEASGGCVGGRESWIPGAPTNDRHQQLCEGVEGGVRFRTLAVRGGQQSERALCPRTKRSACRRPAESRVNRGNPGRWYCDDRFTVVAWMV